MLDRDTNSVSLIDVIERLEAPPQVVGVTDGEGEPIGMQIPGGRPCLLSLWHRSSLDTPERLGVRIRITGPNKDKVGGVDAEVNLMEHARTRLFVDIPGLPYKGPGLYRFSVEVPNSNQGWEEANYALLEVAGPGAE